MNRLDVLLGLVLALGVWRGLRTGAAAQIVSSVGWVGAFIISTALMAPVGLLVAASLGVSERTAPVLGFVVLFGGVIAALTVAAHAISATLKAVKLGALDALAGAGAGGLRAAFGLSVLLMATSFAPLPGGEPLFVSVETREGSLLVDPVEAIAPEVWAAVRTVTPGLQAALVDKFHTWQAGRSEAITGETPLQ